MILSNNETTETKSIMEVKKNLQILETNMKVLFPCVPPTCCEDMGLLDILISTFQPIIKAIEEAFNLILFEPEKYPMTCSRMASLCSLKVVKDTTPSHEKLVTFYRAYRRFYSHEKCSPLC